MTEFEFKCIELYFDKYTQEEDVYGNYYKIIKDKNIDNLLEDIATLVEVNK